MSAKTEVTMEDVKNALAVLEKIYDSVRVIKPLSKKTVNFSDGLSKETNNNCYDFWSSGKVCSNCISMRAFLEKDTFIKLNWADDKIFMVIAVPVQNGEETVILELFKEVTSSISVDLPETMKNNSLLKTLNEIGQLQIKDSLTDIYNRRFIDERLPSDIFNCSVDLTPLSIVFADIDHFKKVNDTYGHVAGDHILKEFAALLQGSVTGKDDWVARYGGEEFLIVLRNSDMASAAKFTETLRSTVENNVFYYDGNSIKITSSFGVCTLHKNWRIKAEELMEYIDRNLYTAKSSGRNRFIASEL